MELIWPRRSRTRNQKPPCFLLPVRLSPLPRPAPTRLRPRSGFLRRPEVKRILPNTSLLSRRTRRKSQSLASTLRTCLALNLGWGVGIVYGQRSDFLFVSILDSRISGTFFVGLMPWTNISDKRLLKKIFHSLQDYWMSGMEISTQLRLILLHRTRIHPDGADI